MNCFEKLWYSTKPLTWYQRLLIPFAKLYQAIISLRSLLYRFGLKQITHFDVPVIVVGNLTVGGTGKTPVVLALIEWLKSQGYSPGIVSRGYGAKTKVWPQIVSAESSASVVGDEPLMLFKKTAVPVVCDPNRVRAVNTLLENFKCDVVVSDDGLQHLSMGRAVEIAVVDATRQFGNGYCLPLGPLREGVGRLQEVDFVVYRGAQEAGLNPTYQVEIVADKLISLKNPSEIIQFSDIAPRKTHALAAIGNPESFFKLLRQHGLVPQLHVLRDHHPLCQDDFAFLQSGECVVMTEKDAIKCSKFADERFFYLIIRAKISENLLLELSKLLKLKVSDSNDFSFVETK